MSQSTRIPSGGGTLHTMRHSSCYYTSGSARLSSGRRIKERKVRSGPKTLNEDWRTVKARPNQQMNLVQEPTVVATCPKRQRLLRLTQRLIAMALSGVVGCDYNHARFVERLSSALWVPALARPKRPDVVFRRPDHTPLNWFAT